MSLYLPLLTSDAAQMIAARAPDLAISLPEVVMLMSIENRSTPSSGATAGLLVFLSFLLADFPPFSWVMDARFALSTASRMTWVKNAVRSTRCEFSREKKSSLSCESARKFICGSFLYSVILCTLGMALDT